MKAPARAPEIEYDARMTRDPVIAWLMKGDPAIRWQTMRDLLDRRPGVYERERRRIASEGWGRVLLDRQNADGNWGKGPYRPKWTSTTYTMQLLGAMGLAPRHPAALRACRVYLDEGIGDDGGINFWGPRRRVGETCVTGMILQQLCYFDARDPRVERLIEYLLREQMDDGGWNCLRDRGAQHSSFHTTLSVLEGLQAYVNRSLPSSRAVLRAARRGREFFLEHHLFRSSTTGNIVQTEMTRFHFPPYWRHDVLRALDAFRAAQSPREPRLGDAISLVLQRRRPDGRWELARGYPGIRFFDMEKAGSPSRWNTLRALRVLRWWNGVNDSPSG